MLWRQLLKDFFHQNYSVGVRVTLGFKNVFMFKVRVKFRVRFRFRVRVRLRVRVTARHCVGSISDAKNVVL